MTKSEPPADCAQCPRLHDFIAGWRAREPDWHNGPVPTWLPPGGPDDVSLLIVGLAPGLRGANRTGRPFTGDHSGDMVFSALVEQGLATGAPHAQRGDGLELSRTAITNAVRCVPPENRPTASEINTCRSFLTATVVRFQNLRAIVTLGRIAHESTIRALGARVSAHPFGHGAATEIDGVTVFSSYHCSRYNVNTGVLTTSMFDSFFKTVSAFLQR
jgi:uracil-DNA glycosylase family 4